MSKIPGLVLKSPKVSPLTEKLIRAAIIISRSRDQKVTDAAHIYLRDLMRSNSYSNVVIKTFLEEIAKDGRELEKKLEVKILRFTELRKKVGETKKDDKQYLLQYQLLPLRHEIETIFTNCLNEKYKANSNFVISDASKRISKSADELRDLILGSIFQSLSLYKLEDLEQYKKIQDPQSFRKFISDLPDYECFFFAFEYNDRIGMICQRMEELIRVKSRQSGCPINIQLTATFWKLYVGILVTEKVGAKIGELVRKSKTNRSGELPLSPSSRDPGIYISYLNCSMKELRYDFELSKFSELGSDDVVAYLDYVKSYISASNDIIEAIESLIPSIASMGEKIYDQFSSIKTNYSGQKIALSNLGIS